MELKIPVLNDLLIDLEKIFGLIGETQVKRETPSGFQILFEEILKMITKAEEGEATRQDSFFSEDMPTSGTGQVPPCKKDFPVPDQIPPYAIFSVLSVVEPYGPEKMISAEKDEACLFSASGEDRASIEDKVLERKWNHKDPLYESSSNEHSLLLLAPLSEKYSVENGVWARDFIPWDGRNKSVEDQNVFLTNRPETEKALKNYWFNEKQVLLDEIGVRSEKEFFIQRHDGETGNHVLSDKNNEDTSLILYIKNGRDENGTTRSIPGKTMVEEKLNTDSFSSNTNDKESVISQVKALEIILKPVNEGENTSKVSATTAFYKIHIFPRDNDTKVAENKEEQELSQIDKPSVILKAVTVEKETEPPILKEGTEKFKRESESEASDSQKELIFSSPFNESTQSLKEVSKGTLARTFFERIEKAIESHHATAKTNQLTLKMELDGGESLKLTLKDVGERVVVEVKTRSETLATFIDTGRYEITRALEEKNIPVTIYVNSESKEGEKREQRERIKRYAKETQSEDFDEKIRSLI